GVELASYAAQSGMATYYRPENPQALRDDIGFIIGNVRSCAFSLNHEVDMATAFQGSVQLDCQNVPHDAANGWRLNSSTELELVGEACQHLKVAPDPLVFISFPCETIIK